MRMRKCAKVEVVRFVMTSWLRNDTVFAAVAGYVDYESWLIRLITGPRVNRSRKIETTFLQIAETLLPFRRHIQFLKNKITYNKTINK